MNWVISVYKSFTPESNLKFMYRYMYMYVALMLKQVIVCEDIEYMYNCVVLEYKFGKIFLFSDIRGTPDM